MPYTATYRDGEWVIVDDSTGLVVLSKGDDNALQEVAPDHRLNRKPSEPIPSLAEREAEQLETGFFGSVAQGALRGVLSAGTIFSDIAGESTGAFGTTTLPSGQTVETIAGFPARRPAGIVSGFAEGASQFAVPFMGALKAVNVAAKTSRALSAIAGGTKTATFARVEIASALGDALASGDGAPVLANLLETYDVGPELVRSLAVNRDDSPMINRAKAVVEGILVGGLFEGAQGAARVAARKSIERVGTLLGRVRGAKEMAELGEKTNDSTLVAEANDIVVDSIREVSQVLEDNPITAEALKAGFNLGDDVAPIQAAVVDQVARRTGFSSADELLESGRLSFGEAPIDDFLSVPEESFDFFRKAVDTDTPLGLPAPAPRLGLPAPRTRNIVDEVLEKEEAGVFEAQAVARKKAARAASRKAGKLLTAAQGTIRGRVADLKEQLRKAEAQRASFESRQAEAITPLSYPPRLTAEIDRIKDRIKAQELRLEDMTKNRGKYIKSAKEDILRGVDVVFQEDPGVSPRGATTFLDETRAVITAFDKADLSTFLHEVAHVYERWMSPEDLAATRKWLGIGDDVTLETSHREAFADAFEQYWLDGKAPTKELGGVFSYIQNVLKTIYDGAAVTDRPITDGIRSVFDGLADSPYFRAGGPLVATPAKPNAVHSLLRGVVDQDALESKPFGTQKDLKELIDEPEGGSVLTAIADGVKEIRENNYGLKDPLSLEKVSVRAGDLSPRELVAATEKLRKLGVAGVDAEVALAATGNLKRAIFDNVQRLSKELDEAYSDEKAVVLATELGRMTALTADVSAVKSQASRLMNASKIQAKATDEYILGKSKDLAASLQRRGIKLSDIIESLGGREGIKKRVKKALTAKKPSDLDPSGWTKAGDIAFSYYINNLLSGWKTLFWNELSNLLNTGWRPVERALGGVLTGNLDQARRGLSQFIGLGLSFGEGQTAARRSFTENREILDAMTKTEMADNRQLGKFRLGALFDTDSERNLAIRAIESLGALTEIPGRMLRYRDEAWKQVNFRASMYSDMMAQSRDKGPTWIRDQIREAADDPIGWLERQEGFVDDEIFNQYVEMVTGAIQAGRKATFTETPEGISRTMLDIVRAAQRIPGIRYIIPFARTPINIFAQAIQKTPAGVAPLLANAWKKLRGIPYEKMSDQEIAQRVGGVVMGTTFMVLGYGMWADGRLTGGAPNSKTERDAWYAAGNIPYSIKVGDTWVQYGRLEPVSTVVGMVADTFRVANDPDTDGNTAARMISGLGHAIVEMTSEKTFLQGLSRALEIFRRPEGATRLLSGIAEGAIPFSSFFRQTTQTLTGQMVYSDTPFFDRIHKFTLGLTDPSIGWRIGIDGTVFKDYVREIEFEDDKDPVGQELSYLRGAVSLPTFEKIGPVPLDKIRFEGLKLMFNERIRGKTWYETVSELIASEEYQRMPSAEGLTRADIRKHLPQARMIQAITNRYESVAKQRLIEKYKTKLLPVAEAEFEFGRTIRSGASQEEVERARQTAQERKEGL